MTRLQILELPEGTGDDRAPFVLVVDEVSYPTAEAYQIVKVSWEQLAQQIGAQGCIFTDETVDIPANETPVDPDGYPLKIRVEGDFEQFREQVQDEIRKAQEQLRQAIHRDV